AANDVYDEACTAVMFLGPLQKVDAIAKAKAARDGAIANADKTFEAAKANADAAYQADINATLDASIKAISDARASELEGQMQAATAREVVRAAAGIALSQALAAVPLAAPIQEAFATRINDQTAQCEEDKSVVLTRMRGQLADLA